MMDAAASIVRLALGPALSTAAICYDEYIPNLLGRSTRRYSCPDAVPDSSGFRVFGRALVIRNPVPSRCIQDSAMHDAQSRFHW